MPGITSLSFHRVFPRSGVPASIESLTKNTNNALVAHEWGVDWLDSSNGGIGGCPFAPAATGNIATEDLVYLLSRMGVDTGLSMEKLLPIASFLSDALGYQVPAFLPRAGNFPD